MVPILAVLALVAFFLLPRPATAEQGDKLMLDVSDPLSVDCGVVGNFTQVHIRAFDTVTQLSVEGFSIPVDALKAGWSITLSREGSVDRVRVHALWRGQAVDRVAVCKVG